MLKRLILRAGGAVAHRGGRLALITGDAIGQVSSQTLQNLAVISQASPSMPVLRPLLGFNKEEILALARRIGIYELAAAVAEYCDLTPPKPNTRAALREVAARRGAARPRPARQPGGRPPHPRPPPGRPRGSRLAPSRRSTRSRPAPR